MATKIRGAQINESIAGVGLELNDNTLNVLIDGYTLRATASGGGLEVTAVNLQPSLSDGETSGLTSSGTTNGTIGQALYVDSGGAWALAKADAESTMPVAAIAVDGSTALTYGYIRNDTWGWTPGGLIYASTATAGALTQDVPTASGSQVQVVGVAISADMILFNPDYTTVELGDSPFYTKEELTTSGVLDVRYYTEDEIDGMLAGISGAIITDHGGLSGLSDDDHPQYSLADGTRAFIGTVSGVAPTQNAHLTTKQYVDTLVTTASGDILSYVSNNYIDNSEMTTISGDILQFVSDNYIDNSEMTTISGDIIDYVDGEISSISGALTADIIWEYVDTPTEQIRPKAAYMGKAIYTSGNMTIGGDLTVTGTTFFTDTEHVLVSDNVMILNYGEPGNGVTGVTAGIQIDRGQETDYLFVFDERSDNFRIGVSGTQSSFNDYPLQPVATREETPTNTRVAWWDAANYTFRTHGDTYVTINSGTDTIVMAVNDTTEVTIDTGGFALKTGADVNEISTTMGVASTDDQLATAKAIYDYIDTVSGSISGSISAVDHNDLNGLQGGNGSDEYYHLDLTAFTALSGVDGTQVGQWDTAYSHSQITTGNPHSVTYSEVGAIQDAADTVKDTHIDWGSGPNQVDLDDVPDGSSYERVAASQLNSGIYIDATDSVKGIASFSSDNFAVTSGAVTIKDEGVSEPELLIGNAPTDGYYLQYTTASGMVWTNVSEEGVLETDFQLDNLSSTISGSNTSFTLGYAPVPNSLQVYLNGLLQEKGGGLDYTNTGTSVDFTIAPLVGDILIAHYVKQG